MQVQTDDKIRCPTERKTCSVMGCNAQRAEGDLLFCSNCRANWVTFCIAKGIKEVMIPEDKLNYLLETFKREGIGWRK